LNPNKPLDCIKTPDI